MVARPEPLCRAGWSGAGGEGGGERLRRVPGREVFVVAAIALASLAVRLAPALVVDPFQDEALYWWQGHEGLSFCPHPPATALLVRAATAALGHGLLSLRLGSLLAGTASVVLAYLLGRELGGGRAGVWAAGLFAVCPLFVTAGTVTTPDAPLLALWLLFMYVALRASRGGGMLWWLGAGVVLAAGLYAKYMMVLGIPALALALLLSQEGRSALRRPGPWMAVGLGLALFVPVLLAWDPSHGAVTLRYQLESRHQWVLDAGQAGQYVLRHLGAISPVLMPLVLWATVRGLLRGWKGEDPAAWAAAFAFVPIAFFLVPGAFTRQQMIRVQWDETGYAAGIVALGVMLGQSGGAGRAGRRRRKFGVAALAGGVVVSGALVLAALWPGLVVRAGLRPPTRRTMGWRKLAGRLAELRRESSRPDEPIVTESFAPAMCIGFHLRQRRDIYSLDDRQNREYGVRELLALWGMDQRALERDTGGQEVLYVHSFHISKHRRGPQRAKRVHGVYSQVEKVADVYVEIQGRRLRHFGIFRCRGLRPGG